MFKPIEGKRLSQTISIVTADGSLGERGSVMDACPRWSRRRAPRCSTRPRPPPTLGAIAAFCQERGIPAQVAVEERMGCGFGLCHTCVVPVARKDGSGYDHLRSCVDGPVFNPARVLWDRWLSEAPTMLPTPARGPAGGAFVAGVKRSLAVDLGGVVLPTPVMIAAGCAGTGRELAGLVELRKVGAIVSRTITLEPEKGSPTPRSPSPPRVSSGRPGCRTPASTPSSPTSSLGSRARACP